MWYSICYLLLCVSFLFLASRPSYQRTRFVPIVLVFLSFILSCVIHFTPINNFFISPNTVFSVIIAM